MDRRGQEGQMPIHLDADAAVSSSRQAAQHSASGQPRRTRPAFEIETGNYAREDVRDDMAPVRPFAAIVRPFERITARPYEDNLDTLMGDTARQRTSRWHRLCPLFCHVSLAA